MNDSSHLFSKYQQLLRDLKSTVEGLLVTQVANVWSIYGGLNRLHNAADKIFKHGSKGSGNETSYFNFIQGLEWLQPESTKSIFSLDCEYRPHVPAHFKDNKPATWLYRSLESYSLSQKLSWLLSDKSHLSSCYQSYAFLCQEQFAEATLICLRAVERNQASLMSDINPYLFLPKTQEFHKRHRRCSSFPDSRLKKINEEKSNVRKRPVRNASDSLCAKGQGRKTNIKGKLRPWLSMPSLQVPAFDVENRYHLKSKTTPSTPVYTKKAAKLSPYTFKSDYITLGSKKNITPESVSMDTHQLNHILIDNLDIVEHTATLSSSQSSDTLHEELISSTKSMPASRSKTNLGLSPPISVMDSFLPMPGEKDYTKFPKKTFIEDGGMSVLPMATGNFPKPTKGQSLLSFLSSGQFARANAELDRENAHFNISEAIISAMEQIKCKQSFKMVDEQMDESDPEIMDLKQRIRLRRTQRAIEKHRKFWVADLASESKTDTTTTVSPRSTPSGSPSEDTSSDEVEDLEIDEVSNLEENAGLSMSMASLYSEADLTKRTRGAPDGSSDILSAEGVALSLISKFKEKELPRASDLEWLVSDDSPRELPLPKNWPVSPGSTEENITLLRGTSEWAPPRPQIIFTLHPVPSRKVLMDKQNNRCAGCSMRVAPKYVNRFRYCTYLGRYFCTGCHTNQLALIPGRVLQKWDFKRYPVSTFSYRLLEQMYTDPLFRVFEINKNISKFSKNLLFCKRYRLGLFYLKDFIFTCKHAVNIKERLQKEMSNALGEPDVYSMEDLVKIRSGEMKSMLNSLVEICCKHTTECQLCLARGFICEVCRSDEIIFPWQMKIVSRCDKCRCCYHITCWSPEKGPCQKCLRIQKRRESTTSSSSSSVRPM